MDLPKAIQLYNDERDANTYKVQPATVVSFDDKGFVDVELSVNPSGVVIRDVPVMFLAGGGIALTFKLRKGDQGLALFSDVSLDNYKQKRGKVDEPDERRNAMSDALFLPSLGFAAVSDSDHGLVRRKDLQAAFDELRGTINSFVMAYNSHVHPAGSPNTGTPSTAASQQGAYNVKASDMMVE